MDRILLAPEPLIRSVLVALCDSDRVHARSLRYLDRLEKLHPPPPSAGTTKPVEPAYAQPQPASLQLLGKRKAPEPPPPQICIQCKYAFHPESNNPQACAFHHGRLDMNTAHRTWSAGEGAERASQNKPRGNDTEDNREDRPEGFLWSCCGRDGAGPGCTEGSHLAIRADDRSKRARYAGADPDELRMFEGKVLKPNEFVNDYLVDDSSDSEDDEVAWSAGAASRDLESQAVEGGGGGGGGDDGDQDVRSEATERDSGGGSPRSDVGD